MGSLGAPLTMDFVIHFEAGAGLRVGEKRRIGSTGSTHDGGIELHYYEYEVYCGRSVLVGQVLQTAIMQDMDIGANEWFRPGGLCSILTLNIHPGLAVEYRGHSIPVQTAQYMQMGQLVSHPSSNKMRLLGRMDVCACLPCCCFLPKLLDPNILPWNQYDVYDPSHDFSKALEPKPMDRGPSAPPEPKSAKQPQPRYDSSTKVANHASKEHASFSNSYNNGRSSASAKQPSRDADIQALKQLKSSGVLSRTEYISKVNQVKAKYKDTEIQSELDTITKLYEDGILNAQEYETKRGMVMKLHH